MLCSFRLEIQVMTSSTSNSNERINHSSRDSHRRYRARRQVAIYTVLLGGLTLILAMGIVNLSVEVLRYYYLNPFSIQRIKTAGDNLDTALKLPKEETREVVYVLGSSLVHFGFSPDEFDTYLNERDLPTLSYNFGFGNADPSIHIKFARKLARMYANEPDRIDRIIYEFAPHGATIRRAETTGQLDHATTAVLSSWKDIGKKFFEDPEDAFALINTRVFRNGVPAEAITHMLSMPIKIAERNQVILEEPEPMENLGWELYHQLREDWSKSIPLGGWSSEYRGGFPPTASDKAMKLSSEVMRRMQDPIRMEASRQQRIACCDLLELEMDQTMINNVIQTIRYAQSVSSDVDIVIMPLNQDVVKLTKTAEENFAKALAQIVEETGVDVLDIYKQPYLGVEYFFDVDHYTFFKGRSKVTELMAKQYLLNIKNKGASP